MECACWVGGGNDGSRERTGWAAPETAGRRRRGARFLGSPRARAPRESRPLQSIQSKRLSSDERREMLWLPEKPRFCLAAESPQDGEFPVRSREVFYNLSVPNAQKSPQSGRCPMSQAGKVGKGASPQSQLSAPRNAHPGWVCASSPVINYRTQGGICKPHITNSTGLSDWKQITILFVFCLFYLSRSRLSSCNVDTL